MNLALSRVVRPALRRSYNFWNLRRPTCQVSNSVLLTFRGHMTTRKSATPLSNEQTSPKRRKADMSTSTEAHALQSSTANAGMASASLDSTTIALNEVESTL